VRSVTSHSLTSKYCPSDWTQVRSHFLHWSIACRQRSVRIQRRPSPVAATTAKPTRSSADADNGLDAFSGQSRSTNMVPFHMLHIVSYCAIVTLSLRQSLDIRLQKNSWPWNGGQRSLKVI